MKNAAIIIFAVILFHSAGTSIKAATPDTLWTRTYGGSGSDIAYSVKQTKDNGFIVAGKTNSIGKGDYDAWLIRLDSIGDSIWTKTYGGTQEDIGHSVVQLGNDKFAFAGWSASFGSAGRKDAWLVTTKSNGDIVKSTYVGDTLDDKYFSITADGNSSEDSGIYAVGYMGKKMICDPLCNNDYKDVLPFGFNYYMSDNVTKEGNSICRSAGNTVVFGLNSFIPSSLFVESITKSGVGSTRWQSYNDSAYPGGMSFYGVAGEIQPTSDSGFIIVGTSTVGSSPCIKVRKFNQWFQDITRRGNWIKAFNYPYPQSNGVKGYCICQTSDKGFLVGGVIYEQGLDSNALLIRLDSAGNTLWTSLIGGTNADAAYSVTQANDGGFVIVGFTRSFGAGAEDVWVIKYDAEGIVNLSTDTLNFFSDKGSQNTPIQTVNVNNSSYGLFGQLSANISYINGTGWLQVSAKGAGNSQKIDNYCNTSGLSAGYYTAICSLSASGISQRKSPKTYIINLTVSETTELLKVSSNPHHNNFRLYGLDNKVFFQISNDKFKDLSLSVYDLKGNLICQYDAESVGTGNYIAKMNRNIGSGVFYAILKQKDRIISKKINFIKGSR